MSDACAAGLPDAAKALYERVKGHPVPQTENLTFTGIGLESRHCGGGSGFGEIPLVG